MSSKKVSPKATKAPAKKAPVKAPAKKAPAKPAAKAAAKPAKPAAKAPAKPAAKAAAKPAKKAAPAKAAKPVAKPAPKAKDSKNVKKAAPAKPAKAVAKPAAKPAPKAAAKPAKPAKVAAKPAAKPAKAAAAKPAPKAAAKPEPKAAAKKPVEKPAAEKAEKVEKVTKAAKVEAKPVEKPAAKPVEVEPVAEAPAADSKPSKKPGPDYAYAVLLQGVKRLSKTIMFIKVDESEDRSNKKKMSSDVKNLDMKPTSAIRHKSSLAEETQEELTERILKELEEQNKMFEREAATQMCTRCNRNLVSPEFWVDKHLGFCEECAAILKLGQSKEARKVEYQLGAMDGDSLDEEDDDIIGPDADDLKAAEEDLADMED